MAAAHGSRCDVSLDEVREYWDSHLNLTQFLDDQRIEVGSDEFFEWLRGTFDRYDYKADLLREFSRDVGGGKLLDVGCGLGVELAELGDLGFDVTGIDLAPSAVRICNDYLTWRGVPGTAQTMNAEDLQFPDACFEAVYSSGVLQHTPDMDRAISEIRRVLKPGGRILAVLYHRHSWFYLLQRASGANIEFESEDAPIVKTFSQTDVKRLFREFCQVEVRCEYFRPVPTRRHGTVAALYNRLLVPILHRMPERWMRRFGWHLVVRARKQEGSGSAD